MTTCYIPRPTPVARAIYATRAGIRSARMRWRQVRSTLTPLGWFSLAGVMLLIIFIAALPVIL